MPALCLAPPRSRMVNMDADALGRERYTVHAERYRVSIEFRAGTPWEAISKARKLMGNGATGVYIYDDEVDAAYWPDQFAKLVQVLTSERRARDARRRG
jgi:hypothetical protein